MPTGELSNAARETAFFTLINGLYQTEINQVARLGEISALEKLLTTQPALLPDSLRRIQMQTPQTPRLLLAIDQFEELYTLNPPAVQQAALESLLALLDNALNAGLLITLRADFLGQALNHPRLAHWLDADRHKLLGNLSATGLLEAITRPLQADVNQSAFFSGSTG